MLRSRYRKNRKYNKNKLYGAQNLHNKKPESPSIKNSSKVFLSETNLQPPDDESGFLSVGVYTALGALPVPNAVVTIYVINEDGEEEALYQLITDVNGRVPNIELPVVYDPTSLPANAKYYYTNYNMRVQAENYNTFNVRAIRIFPGITTDYNINLVPVVPGSPNGVKEYNVTIPTMPIDRTID